MRNLPQKFAGVFSDSSRLASSYMARSQPAASRTRRARVAGPGHQLLDLPAELLSHVAIQGLTLEAALNARLSCLTLHKAVWTPAVWRAVADILLREHPHLTAPPVFPRLGVEPSLWWLARLHRASRLRFLRDEEREQFAGHLVIPSFGRILGHPAVVGADGLAVRPGQEEDLEYRAEIEVPDGVGAFTLTIDMSDAGAYDHYIYLRCGTEGRACYWMTTPGLHHLRLDGTTCSLVRSNPEPSLLHEEVVYADLHVRLDDRMANEDPSWHAHSATAAVLPTGPGKLYVGVTLYRDDSTATLQKIVLH